MSNEIKVGEWTLTPIGIGELNALHRRGCALRQEIDRIAPWACQFFGIDPTTDSVARDIAEEIVLHGTPVDEVIKKLQRHLRGGLQ